MAAKGSGAWAGWVLFAGTILLVTGLINVFQGIVALVDDERLALTPNKLVIVDVTGLGWTLLIAGLLMIGAGAGLLMAQTWARIVSIILVSLHLIIQVALAGRVPGLVVADDRAGRRHTLRAHRALERRTREPRDGRGTDECPEGSRAPSHLGELSE